jgi:hypothetical protein
MNKKQLTNNTTKRHFKNYYNGCKLVVSSGALPSPGRRLIASKTLFVFFKTVLIPLPCLQNLEMQSKTDDISVS